MTDLNVKIDNTIEIIAKLQPYKTKSVPIGSLIGGSDDQNYYKETAICKSDCLLLMIQNNIFEQMKVF